MHSRMRRSQSPDSRNQSELAYKSGWQLKNMGSEGDPIEKLRLMCLSKGSTGFLVLGRMLRKRDEDGNKNLSLERFIKGIKDTGMNIDDSDIIRVFECFDPDHNGSINIDEFLDCVRPPMPDTRMKIIEECFKKLDENGDGHLTVENLRNVFSITSSTRYITGDDDEEPLFQTFLAHFDIDTKESGIVTREEFLNYYAGVSASIDNDCYFDLMMRHAYKLKNCPKSPMTRAERDLANRCSKKLQSIGPDGNPVEKLRLLCLSTGSTGILVLGKIMRKMDKNGSRKLNLDEFILCIRESGMDMNISEAKKIFQYFDMNNEGFINIDELIAQVRPPMSDSRKKIIEKSFQKVDRNGDGHLTVANLRRMFSIKSSSTYISGEDDEEVMFQKFLAHFDEDKAETGIITREEFLNYYSGISASVDDDCFFDLMMRNSYKL